MIFQTLIIWSIIIYSLKYLGSTTLGCRDKGFKKSEFGNDSISLFLIKCLTLDLAICIVPHLLGRQLQNIILLGVMYLSYVLINTVVLYLIHWVGNYRISFYWGLCTFLMYLLIQTLKYSAHGQQLRNIIYDFKERMNK